MELPEEQFEYQQTLAEINVEIGKARAGLQELQAAKDDYLKQREDEVRARVEQAILASKNALKEAHQNYAELVKYKGQLAKFAQELTDFYGMLTQMTADLEAERKEMKRTLDGKLEELAKITDLHRLEREMLTGEREQIEFLKKTLQQRKRQLLDERQTLDRAWGELRIKQQANA